MGGGLPVTAISYHKSSLVEEVSEKPLTAVRMGFSYEDSNSHRGIHSVFSMIYLPSLPFPDKSLRAILLDI